MFRLAELVAIPIGDCVNRHVALHQFLKNCDRAVDGVGQGFMPARVIGGDGFGVIGVQCSRQLHRFSKTPAPVLFQIPFMIAHVGEKPFHFHFVFKILGKQKARIPAQQHIANVKNDIHVMVPVFSSSGAYIMIA